MDAIELFFTGTASILPVAVLRVLLGLVMLYDALLLLPDRKIWLSNEGVLGGEGTRPLSIFRWLEPTPRNVTIVMVAHIGLCVAFTVGLGDLAVAVALYASVISIGNRNQFILYGGDTVSRLVLFLLIFSPAFDALSLDALWSTGSLNLHAEDSRLFTQLLRVQIVVIYVYSAIHKDQSRGWYDGTAMYGALNNAGFYHLPLPSFMRTMTCSRVLTPLVLVFEYSLVLLLFEPTRPYFAAAAVFFHLGISYSLHVHVFGPLMLACLSLFLWPTEYLGQPDTDTGLGVLQSSALVLYLVHAFLWDLPVRSSFRGWYQRATGTVVRATGLAHRWSMFAGGGIRGSGTTQLEVVVEYEDGRVLHFGWDQMQGLTPDEFGEPIRRRHRRRKFLESVSVTPDLVASQFSLYLQRLATGAEPGARRVSAIALLTRRSPVRRSRPLMTLTYSKTFYDSVPGIPLGHARFAVATIEDRVQPMPIELLLHAGMLVARAEDDDSRVLETLEEYRSTTRIADAPILARLARSLPPERGRPYLRFLAAVS